MRMKNSFGDLKSSRSRSQGWPTPWLPELEEDSGERIGTDLGRFINLKLLLSSNVHRPVARSVPFPQAHHHRASSD
jgi:hypothetical protein